MKKSIVALLTGCAQNNATEAATEEVATTNHEMLMLYN